MLCFSSAIFTPLQHQQYDIKYRTTSLLLRFLRVDYRKQHPATIRDHSPNASCPPHSQVPTMVASFAYQSSLLWISICLSITLSISSFHLYLLPCQFSSSRLCWHIFLDLLFLLITRYCIVFLRNTYYPVQDVTSSDVLVYRFRHMYVHHPFFPTTRSPILAHRTWDCNYLPTGSVRQESWPKTILMETT